MNPAALNALVIRALEEDIGFGDITSSLFADTHSSEGSFTAKADGVIAGIDLIGRVYGRLGDGISVECMVSDGDRVEAGMTLARAGGPTRVLLSGERVILNLLQHLSGIATATKRAVDALNDAGIRICDTRKTLPGLRMLQKYAVTCGGGCNHRLRLDGGVMIKDNHIAAAGSITEAVKRARERTGPMTPVEVETESGEQVLEAVNAGADLIMFDNRTPEQVREWVKLVPDAVQTEVSGGITPETVAGWRGAGVDYISLGYLTHSVTALDISFTITDHKSTGSNR